MRKLLSSLVDNQRGKAFASSSLFLIAILLAVSPSSAYTQTKPNTKEILKRVGDTYRAARSYHVEGILYIAVDVAENYLRLDLPIVMDGARPGKSRLEIKHSSFGYLSVSDGVTDWAYLPNKNQYTSKPTSTGANATASLTAEYKNEVKRKTLPLDIGTASGDMISNYENLPQSVKAAKILREESLATSGRRADCYVVELEWRSAPETFGVRIKPKTLLWIDKTTNLVLRDSLTNRVQAGGKTISVIYDFHYDLIRLDEEVTASLFVFTPPAGAQKVETLEGPEHK